eukprot:PhM_4_TR1302/c1_g2_i1/m.105411
MATRSVASRSSVMNSSARPSLVKHTGLNLVGKKLATEVPVFPLLAVMERKFLRHFVSIHLAIDALQIIALNATPHYEWGSVFKAVSQVVWFFVLPLWDSSHLDLGFYASFCVSWGAVALCLFLWYLGANFLLAEDDTSRDLLKPRIKRIAGYLYHGFTGPFFVPIVHVLMGQALCNDRNEIAWFPDKACDSTLGAISKIAAGAGFITLLPFAYINGAFMRDTNCNSRHRWARAHSLLDPFYLWYRVLAVILFHYFYSRDKMQWYAVYMACTSFVMALAFAVVAPYVRRATTRVRVSSLLLGSVWAALGALSFESDVRTAFKDHHVDMILICITVLPLLWLFGKVAYIRSSRHCLEALASLREGILIDREPVYPVNLPQQDDTYPFTTNLMKEFVTDMSHTDGHNYHLMTAYIDTAYLPTDAELAVRYLLYYGKITRMTPTLLMISYCSRIYTKFMTKYPTNHYVIMAFAQFLHATAVKPRFAMTLVEMLDTCDVPVNVRYQAHRLHLKLTDVLNIQNTSHSDTLQRAKKRHKEALMHMSEFWTYLLADEVDTQQLSIVAKAITSAREDSLWLYQRAISRNANSTELICCYGMFLDGVMLVSDGFEQCKTVLEENRERKKTRAMRGAKSGAMGGNETFTQLPAVQTTSTDARASAAVNRFFHVMNVLFLVLLLIIIGLLVYTVVIADVKIHEVDRTAAAGRVRSLAPQATYVVQDLTSGNQSLIPSAVRARTSRELVGLQTDFQSYHNALTYGKYLVTDPATAEFYKSPTQLIRVFNVNNTFVELPKSVWVIGNELSYVMSEVASTQLPRHVQYMMYNVPRSISLALNRTMLFLEETHTDYVVTDYAVISVLFIMIAAVAISIAVLLSVNFKKLNQSQMDVLGLFTFIPRSLLTSMQQNAKQRALVHDSFLRLKSKEMTEQLIGKDDDNLRGEAALLAGLAAEPAAGEGGEVKGEVNLNRRQSLRIPPPQIDDAAIIAERERAGTTDKKKRADVSLGGTRYTLPVMLVLGAGILVTALLAFEYFDDAVEHLDKRLDLSQQVDSEISRVESMIELSRQIVEFGEASLYYGTYRTLANRRSFSALETYAVTDTSDEEIATLMHTLRSLDDDIQTIERIALVLAHSSYGMDNGTMKDILLQTWQREDNLVTLREEDMLIRPTPYTITNRDHDMALGAQDKFLLARGILHSDSFESKKDQLIGGMNNLRIKFRELKSDRFDRMLNVIRGVLGCGIAVCVFFILLVVRLHRQSHALPIYNTSSRVTVSLLLCFFGALATMGMMIACISALSEGFSGDKIESDFGRADHIIDVRERYRHSIDSFTTFPRAFAEKGDLYHYVQYRKHMPTNDPVSFLDEVKELGDVDRGIADLTVILREMARLHNITFVLAGTASGVPMEYMWELANFTWNFYLEQDSRTVAARWPNEPLRYNTRIDDLAKPNATRMSMARRAVYSPRFLELEERLRSAENGLFPVLLRDAKNDIDNHKDQLELLFGFTVGIGAATPLLVLVLYTMLYFNYFTLTSYPTTSTTNKDGDAESGQEKTNRKCKLALAFIIALVAAATAVSYLGVILGQDRIKILNYASAREYLVAESMVWANAMRHDPSAIPEGKQKLLHIINDISSARDELYFGVDYGKYATVGTDSTQDELLFDTGAFAASLYDTCNATMNSETVAALQPGISILYDGTWAKALRLLASASTSDEVVRLVKQLDQLVQPLMDGLRFSTARFEEKAREDIKFYRNIVIAILAVAIAVTGLEYLFLFKPIVQQLIHEEEGTKLMLGMIPDNVVEAIPEISEYLETGNVADERGQDLADALADMSTVPVIAIDSKGIILKFSHASEKVFGYTASEVTGTNVKVLMPADVARLHDNFLLNYRRTGIKRVIDVTRRTRGLRKNGQVFPLELNVREFIIGDDSVFISFCRDLTDELAVEAENILNKYVCDMNTTPIVAIDAVGTVILSNSALSRVFGYTNEEVLGENVKILMSSEIATHHDGYLSNYAKTGVKKVLDLTNRLTAQRKNGELFSIDLTVREIKSSGSSSMFIAYIRDVTDEHRAEMQNEANDTIANLSPVPIIAINEKGTILKFSRAASQVFGFTQEEVLKRRMNVSMLMPDEIAAKHDGYLSRYLVTGEKRVIDRNRDIVCKRRGGYFTAVLTVKEVRKQGTAPVFLSYLQESTQLKAMEREQNIGLNVRDRSLLSIVAITTKGIIKEFNPAATQLFGYSRSEAVGQNVKMLTPPQIAKEHDGYLKRYSQQTTRLAVQRSVTAKLKDGSFVPVEIAVREVPGNEVCDDMYIGYVRSTLAERKLTQAFLINDALSNLSPTPIIAIDHVGTILRFSTSAEEVWGYTLEDVLGQNIKMLMPPTIAVNHDEYLARYQQTGIKSVVDTTRKVLGMRKSGQAFPLEISVREIKKQGQNSTFVAYARDMTDDANAEQEKDLGLTISQFGTIPLVQANSKGDIIFANRAAESEFGYSDGTMVGMNVRELTPPSIRHEHDSYLERYHRTGESRLIGKLRRVIAVRKDGSEVEVEVKLSESKSLIAGRTSTYVAYLRNIGTQLRLEEANRLIDSITNLSSVPIIAIDARGLVIKFSTAAERCFGFSADEVLGENVKMLMPEEVAEKHDGYLKAYAKNRIKTVVDSLRRVEARRKNGTTLPVELTVKELVKEGRESTFVAYARDATEDTNLEKAVELSQTVTMMGTVPMFCITPVGKILRANNAAFKQFGYTSTELIGSNVKMIMPEEIAVNHDEFLAAYARTGVK